MGKKYLKGLFVKSARAGAPDFVKGAISIKREDLIKELQGMTDDWINLDIKEGQDGGLYASINDWKPEKKKEFHSVKSLNDKTDDLPF